MHVILSRVDLKGKEVRITGIHASFATPDAAATRKFLSETLGLSSMDIGGGFLIFDVPRAEVAATDADVPAHGISFSCDDIKATVEELERKDVRFTDPISEEVWGWQTSFEMPGGLRVTLYEPKYGNQLG